MTTDDLAFLCRSCGLCCDGSLFGRVPLEHDEVAIARRHRLRVVGNGKGFEQPCVALVERDASGPRRACSLYAERPQACRSFACRLYERHRREGGPLAPRLAAVERVRELMADLRAQELTAADFDPHSPSRVGERQMRAYDELQARLEEDFARAADTRDRG